MDYNPWNVDSIHEFYFLNCPECPFLAKDESYFQDHALKKHPLSFVLFGKANDTDDIDRPFELIDSSNLEDVKPDVDESLNHDNGDHDSKPEPESLGIKEEQFDELEDDNLDHDLNFDDYAEPKEEDEVGAEKKLVSSFGGRSWEFS